MSGPVETEIKLSIKDGLDSARALLEGHGFAIVQPRTLQADQVYDFPDDLLRKSGRLLRVRSETALDHTAAILTYKGPTAPGPHKSREELETSAADGPTLELIFNRLGLVPSFRYEKYRVTYQLSGDPGVVVIDETPIGVFLELEGPSYWIDATASRLGFTPQDYIVASYASLYRTYLTKHSGPPDMVFPK